MTNDPAVDELIEIAAFIAAHADRIPRHRATQAVRLLERVERLIPEPEPQEAA